jgi:Cof subfamily protein (haloacid dehalogenase superfamily)
MHFEVKSMNFTQIKMIICDMDGTLLDNQKKLPPHFNQIYKELYDRNIIFAISSGRQMGEVKKYFEDNKTIYLMAENGGYIQHNGETLLADYMNQKDVYKLVSYVNTLKGMAPMLSGKKAMYAFNKDKELISRHTSHFSISYVEEIEDIDDDIFKITVCDPIDPVKNCLRGPLSLIKGFEVKPSGDCWIDINKKGQSKADSVVFLQNKLGISEEETMVFGDSDNDLSMFKHAYYSYAMKNADHFIQKNAHYVTEEDNDHDGVMKTIQKMIEDEDGLLINI